MSGAEDFGRTFVPMVAMVTTRDGKCPDGYIEITTTLLAPGLRALVHAQAIQIETLVAGKDAEMLRVKACEHIAEGTEGWERLRNECPSTAAVATLRDERAALEAERDAALARLSYCLSAVQGLVNGAWPQNDSEALQAVIAVRAERDKLREALQNLFLACNHAHSENGAPYHEPCSICRAMGPARAALDTKEGT